MNTFNLLIHKMTTMKIPIYVILLLSLTSSSPNQKMWQTSCYNRATFQQEATWCVHACMEISFGPSLFENLNYFLKSDCILQHIIVIF